MSENTPNSTQPSTPPASRQQPAEQEKNVVMETIKAIIATAWGRRIALGLLGIIIFLVGYSMGNFGTGKLKNQIDQKRNEIDSLKKKVAETEKGASDKDRELSQIKSDLNECQLNTQRTETEKAIEENIQKACDAFPARKMQNVIEALYAIKINLDKEARTAVGSTHYFYQVTIRQLRGMIAEIEKECLIDKTSRYGLPATKCPPFAKLKGIAAAIKMERVWNQACRPSIKDTKSPPVMTPEMDMDQVAPPTNDSTAVNTQPAMPSDEPMNQ